MPGRWVGVSSLSGICPVRIRAWLPKIAVMVFGVREHRRVLGEILTWFGVAVAAAVTYAMYRSAVSTDPKDPADD
jgi:hypothetical protein